MTVTRRGLWLLLAGALLAPRPILAQMQPHRAEYALRLGIAANAPRVGTAVQDIKLECDAWALAREVTTELALTPTLKVGLTSRLNGEESRSGNSYRYRTIQIQNGVERTTRGEVERLDGETRVEVVTPDGPERQVLPLETLMPIAAVGQAVDHLHAGATSFALLVFAGEATSAAFQLDVKTLAANALPAAPPSLKPVPAPPGQSWPVQIAVTGLGQPPQGPRLSVRARLFSSGVLERMVIEAGPVTMSAYLQSLQMHPVRCPNR
jgi:hypothetical protein